MGIANGLPFIRKLFVHCWGDTLAAAGSRLHRTQKSTEAADLFGACTRLHCDGLLRGIKITMSCTPGDSRARPLLDLAIHTTPSVAFGQPTFRKLNGVFSVLLSEGLVDSIFHETGPGLEGHIHILRRTSCGEEIIKVAGTSLVSLVNLRGRRPKLHPTLRLPPHAASGTAAGQTKLKPERCMCIKVTTDIIDGRPREQVQQHRWK